MSINLCFVLYCLYVLCFKGNVILGQSAYPETDECYKKEDNGQSYRGKVNVTKTGKTCQRWDSQEPHSHTITEQNYKNSGLDDNYCRSVGSNSPWCYTLNKSSRWEFCPVPECNSTETQTTIFITSEVSTKTNKDEETTNKPKVATGAQTTIFIPSEVATKTRNDGKTTNKPKDSSFNYVIVIVPTVSILVILVIAILICRRRNNKNTKTVEQLQVESDNHPQLEQKFTSSEHQNEQKIGLKVLNTDTVLYENVNLKRRENENEKTGTRINTEDFLKVFKKMSTNNGELFRKQFKEVVDKAGVNVEVKTVAMKPELKAKNRFKNILPFENTRVVIENNESGYINACYIDGLEVKRKYIATQGPLPRTVDDFWLMIVERKCNIIVMLAKCYENGTRKCEKYWPEPMKTSQFGSVFVTNVEEMDFCGFVQRTLNVSAELQNNKIKLTLKQFHFLKWPDHGVPLSTSHLLKMHLAMRKLVDESKTNSPVVVHCSAGAGRTGTFIGFDILLEEIRKQNKVDVYRCVLKMRQQRVQMVQNCDQYMFLYKLIMESYLFNEPDLPSADFLEKFANEDLLKSTAEKESQDLQIVNSMLSMRTLGNRKSDEEQLKIEIEGDAVYLELYEEENIIIATQAPTDNSFVENFWNFVLNKKIGLVVALQNDKNENVTKYWPTLNEKSLHIGAVDISLEEEINQAFIITRKLNISRGEKKTVITHLQFLEWPKHNCPSQAKQVITLVDKIQQTLRECDIPMAMIQCSGGVGRTGTLCAIINLIDRIKLENKVDVFRTVKDLRDCRPEMVNTLDQYIFCYRVVIDYLQSNEIYSNFR